MERITQLEIEIIELKNHLSNARELICNLQIKVDKLQMNEQRKEWMQETVDAFADINAECEDETF
tara:strand:+ start:355 stop:549 length:195 start_codon:yes stop_codon:yes gene_type:complete